MCHNCDTPEMREFLTTVKDTLGLDAVQSAELDYVFLGNGVSGEDRGRDVFDDNSPYGAVPLTVGQAAILFSGVKSEMTGGLGGFVQAVQMASTPMGAMFGIEPPTDEDIAEIKGMTLRTLDAILALRSSGLDRIVSGVEIPDDASALVGDGDGSTS